MNKTQITYLIVTAALVITWISTFQAFGLPVGAKMDGSATIGFGDLHRFEAQKALQVAGALESSSSVVGMGDLHVMDFRLSAPNSASSNSVPGFGDLRIFEAQQSGSQWIPNSGYYSGIEKLHLAKDLNG